MAGKLGALVIEIVATTAKLRQSMTASERIVKKSSKAISRSANRASKALLSIGAGFVGAAGIKKIIAATKEQEAAVRQLEQGLATTGNAVGQSLDELTRKAAELQNVTTFGDEEIIRAQSQLVSFTNIVGEQFDKTLELAADLSTRFGTDLKSSVLQLGKALNDPVANLSALSRSGIQFSKTQKDLIKDLIASGRQLEAQEVILAELETQFGGSARAARDTFGGALEGLSNAAGDLLEAKGGLPEAKEEIEKITKLLQDERTVEAVNDLTTGLAKLAAGAINGATELANLGDQFAINLASLTGNLTLEDEIKQEIKDVERALKGGLNTPVKYLFTSDEELNAELARLQSRLEEINVVEVKVKPVVDENEPVAPTIQPAIVSDKQLTQAKKLYEETLSPLEAYRKELESISALNKAGAFADVGGYETYSRAVRQAAEDFQKLNENATKNLIPEETLESLREAKQIYEDTRTPLEAYRAEIERITALNESGAFADVGGFETYQRAIQQTAEDYNELVKTAEETGEELSTFADQAARNMQDAFADFLFDPFDEGIDGLLNNFLKILQRMAAEAAAAQIFDFIGGGEGGGGDIFSALLSSFDGGGFTGSGPRIGGVDGKGGFLSVVHPNETVIDHTKGQAVGGVTIGSMVFPGVSNQREATLAAGAAGRELTKQLNANQRYS